MRPVCLLVIFSVLAVFPVSSSAQQEHAEAMPQMHAEWLQSPRLQISDDPSTLKFTDPVSSDQPTCYTLRTYFAARVHRQSDQTRIVGYSTCQLSSKYQIKRAIGSTSQPPHLP
jgi:hypothetical protein